MAYANPNLLTVDQSTFENNVNGWVASGTNCTTAVGTQRLAGTYGLKVTFTTAASAAAWTNARTAVTAGSTYVARIPVGIATVQSGLTAQAVIEWWSASTGGTKLSETASPAMPVVAAVGFDNTSYPVAVGVAPAGATYAVLKVVVGGAPTAGGHILVDEVYMGLAAITAGNLFNYQTQSAEVDTTSYHFTNATLARQGTVLATNAGYYCLSATSVASGEVNLRTAAYAAVTPGTTYVAYALFRSVSITATGWVELRWYDSSGNLVSTTSFASTFSAGVTNQVAMVGTCPAGATQVKPVVRANATAAGQVFYLDEISMKVAPNATGNLLGYDEYSNEASLTPWTASNATTARTYFTSSITDGYYGLQVTPSTPALVSMTMDRLIPVTPGRSYRADVLVYRYNAGTQAATITARTRVDWYDSSGKILSADNPDQFIPVSSTATWSAVRLAESRVAPAGAAYARIGLELDHTSTLAQYYVLDNITFVEATPLYTLATSDSAGMVTLVVQYVPESGTATQVTIKRWGEDGLGVPLRGYGTEYDMAPYTAGTIKVEDYEAPLGTRVWYAIEWYDSSNTILARVYTQTITAPVLADGDYVWLKAPGLPAKNVTVMMESPITWDRAARRNSLAIVGRKNPVTITDVRAGREGSLSVLIWDEPSHDQLNQLLDDGLPVLIQAMPGYGVNGNLYLSVGDVSVSNVTGVANEEGWRWTLAVSEVDRPWGGLQGSAASTWQTVMDDYGTWSGVNAGFTNWAGVLTYQH